MECQRNRRAFAASIAVAIALAACGHDDDATSTTLGGSAAQLIAEADGITIDDVDVPNEATRAVQLDQKVALAEKASGRLVLDDVEFEMYMQTVLRVLASDRLDVRAELELGHVTATVSPGTDVRVRLETPSGVVLTTRQPGTQFTACESPDGLTCLAVVRGEVEWQAAGQTESFVAGQSSFAKKGDPPQPAVCLPSDAYEQWFAGARRNEESRALADLVNVGSPCDAGTPSTTEPSGGGAAQPRIVPGTVAWTDTGIDVRSGDLLAIEASGEIQAGPDQPAIGPDGAHDPGLRVFNLPELQGANHAALIGRIGEAGSPFLVGPILKASADRDGRLFLGINDMGVDNNAGAFDVVVTVSPP
jgi:hypothetical protein